MLTNFHLDFEVLDEHVHSLVVLLAERDDDVRVFHRRPDEVVVGRLHESVVLSKHVHDGAPTVGDVSLD